jgi:hypothetical protein
LSEIVIAHPTGESKSEVLKFDFDHRLMVQFWAFVVTSDGGLSMFCSYLLVLKKAPITIADQSLGKSNC